MPCVMPMGGVRLFALSGRAVPIRQEPVLPQGLCPQAAPGAGLSVPFDGHNQPQLCPKAGAATLKQLRAPFGFARW